MRVLKSLHGRLVVALLATLGTVWVGAVAQARLEATKATAADVDERLESSIAHLMRIVVLGGIGNVRSPGEGVRPDPVAVATAESRVGTSRPPSFEIVWRDGRAPMRSADFPRDIGPTAVGFEERVGGARSWRVLTVFDVGQRATGRVALDDLTRGALERRRHRDALRPLLWMLPLLAAVALGSVWLGLAPLRRLERAIEDQEPTEPGSLGLDADAMPVELGRVTAAMERLLLRLRDVQHRQRAFTATAGHELRTPLAGCGVQLQVARRSADPVARDRALELAGRAIDAMDRLVEQLLVLARAGAGVDATTGRRLDFAELVERVVDAWIGRAADACVELGRPRATPGAFVVGNALLLEAMVGNLIDNAVKFSRAGGTVDVAVDVRDGRVVLRVIDRGPGVPEAERERVFDPFHRLDPAVRPGSGLGLPTVRAVAADHGGRAWLETSADGGTEAVVALPAA